MPFLAVSHQNPRLLKPLVSHISSNALPSPLPPATKKAFDAHVNSYVSLLRECSRRRSIPRGLVLHARIVKNGLSSHRSSSAALLSLYSSCGRFLDCEMVFSESRKVGFDLFSWNLAMSARCRCRDLESARNLFDAMPEKNDLSWMIMIDAHMKCGRTYESMKYLWRDPNRSVLSWTAVITGLVWNGMEREALHVFCWMLKDGVLPNEITYSSVVKASYGISAFDSGWSIVGLIIKTGFSKYLTICNCLVTFLQRVGDLNAAEQVFNEMEERDVISWTAMLDAYLEIGELSEAYQFFDAMPEKNEVTWSTVITSYGKSDNAMESLRLFNHMRSDGFKPNVACFLGVLGASSHVKSLQMGENLHCYILKVGMHSDVFVCSSVIDLYCKCGKSSTGRRVFDLTAEKNIVCWNSMVAGYCSDHRLAEAEELFEQTPVKTTVTWNALLDGFVENQQYEKVLESFNSMLLSGKVPNGSTFSSILRSCACMSLLAKGRNVHGKVVKFGLQNDIFIGTALVDMYAKSGDIESSLRFFQQMPERNAVSWTAMIQGLAENGLVEETIKMFNEMEKSKVLPTGEMFLSVLFACSHGGLVDIGFHYFESMGKIYNIRPQPKHYTCMVDLLARAGQLREAEEFIHKMPVIPNASSWASLLSACSTHRNPEIGERAAMMLREMDKENSASYVLLANIYASAGRWKDVPRIRQLMSEAGAKKSGGSSWIQVKEQIHSFSSWDTSHCKSLEIYETLGQLLMEMRLWIL